MPLLFIAKTELLEVCIDYLRVDGKAFTPKLIVLCNSYPNKPGIIPELP